MDQLATAYQNLKAQSGIQRLLMDQKRTLLIRQQNETLGWQSMKFQDYYQGLEVVGSMAIHHRGPLLEQQVTDLLARFDLDVRPSLSPSDAMGIARSLSNVETNEALPLKHAPTLQILPSDDGGSARLIYRVVVLGTREVPGHTVTLDAHSGEVLADISHWITFDYKPAPSRTLAARGKSQVNVFQATSKCQTVDETGAPIYLNQEECDQTVVRGAISSKADDDAKRALNNATRTLAYYLNRHGRDSFDGKGTDVNALVHVGEKFANAFWDSQNLVMGYGDGDGEEFGSFTRGVDVAGHEMTHGVISATADLDYESEYGALNEAIADFFGKMIAKDGHWELGKSLNLDPKAPGLRNLANPNAITYTMANDEGRKVTRPYPAHMSQKMTTRGMCGRANDRCGVHINSTIIGHALYRTVQAIGGAKTENIVYLALTQHMGQRTNFRTGRAAIVKACQQLYRNEPMTCAKVASAFQAVGL